MDRWNKAVRTAAAFWFAASNRFMANDSVVCYTSTTKPCHVNGICIAHKAWHSLQTALWDKAQPSECTCSIP